MVVLKADNLTQIYGDRKTKNTVNAIQGINLKVEKDEFVGIMGASGSGKTTLLNILSGMLPPTTGLVEINSTIISSMDRDEIALFRRHQIGYVFQDYKLLNSLTLEENIMLPMILDCNDTSEIQSKATAIIERLGLKNIINQYPYQASGGEKQKAAIGRALINNPSIVFADEPTGNLDSKSSEIVMKCFKQINNEDCQTILMVTHDLLVASYCNRIIVIKDGRVHLEIIRKADQKQFYEHILDCFAVMEGVSSDV